MEVVVVSCQKRTELGKRATKAVRLEERIPCVLYGGEENLHFTTIHNEVRDLIFTPDFKLANLQLDGKEYKAIIKDIQWNPVTDEIIHIDFLRLIEGVSLKVQVPIHFKGVSPGVKNGGKLMQKVRRVDIKTTPEHLVHEIVLDISKLKLNDSLRIRDIDAGEEVEVLNPPGVPVATVVTPRAMREPLPEDEEEEGEGVEGEGAEGAEEAAEATEE